MTKKEDEENDSPPEDEDENAEKSIKLDTSELTKAVEDFTAAVDKMATLLTKEEDEDDEDEDAEKAKKAEDEEDSDEDDSEEKAKKALEVLKEQGYNVDGLIKVSVDRPDSQPMRKTATGTPPPGSKITHGFVGEALKVMGVE
jgi:hypothetical protein